MSGHVRTESDTAPHRSLVNLRNESNVLGGMSKLLGISLLFDNNLPLQLPIVAKLQLVSSEPLMSYQCTLHPSFDPINM
jgi:hypothetical protein